VAARTRPCRRAAEVTLRLGGIVLAAGAGERMGGPKALLAVEGEPLARLHVRRLREAGCERLVLVTRSEIADRFAADAAIAISSAADPAGSLAVALRLFFPLEPDDVFVITPVDAWPVRVETIARLVEAVRSGAEAATPRYERRGGHPVVVRGRVLAGYEKTPLPLRDVLGALEGARARVSVDDPAVAVDLDTPEDVVRLTGCTPRFAW
jgi:molybdenum cofactor cytidylyltransferase